MSISGVPESVTFGFYNSYQGDRKYSADDISSIFEGIIEDGVFGTIGNKFECSAPSGGILAVNVGTGRCWFNNTWLKNDTSIKLYLGPIESNKSRYDTIAIDINKETRINNIVVVDGSEYGNADIKKAEKAPLAKTSTHIQYPIAFVQVLSQSARSNAKRSDVGIIDTDIKNVVGLVDDGGPPFVRGPLETISVDRQVKEFEAQFDALLKVLDTKIINADQGQLYEPQSVRVNNITVTNTKFTSYKPSTSEDDLYNLGYIYRAKVAINDAGVAESAIPYITFSLSSLKNAKVQIANQVRTYTGGIFIYATGVPAEDIKIKTAEFRNAAYSDDDLQAAWISSSY